MTAESALRSRRRRWGGVALVLAVLAGGVATTAAATVMVRAEQHRHAAQLMDGYADDTEAAVTREVARYRDTLADVAASVSAQSELTIDDFFAITSRLKRGRLPGATVVSFAVAASDARVPAVQAQWRARGARGLRLTPSPDGGEHVFTVFARSFDATGVVVGLDLTRAPEPAEALRSARHIRQVVASRTYVLLKDRSLPAARQQFSFMIAAPVYAAAGTPHAGEFEGWVVMGMRGADFLTEALQASSQHAVSTTLADTSTNPPTVVARSTPDASPGQQSLHRDRTVVIGQNAWRLHVAPTASLLGANDRRMPPLTIGVGLFVTALLGAMTGALAGSRNRALARVDVATAALRVDIERRKDVEAQLQILALHDPLTGLANRTLMRERIGHALAAQRRTEANVALLYIDLDGFKGINDTMGHHAGDQLLIDVAARLRRCLRSSDTVARLGGDEFAVLAEHITAVEHADVVARHVVAALQQPFRIGGETVTVTASVGFVVHRPCPLDTDVDELLEQADRAMYAAKTAGKNRAVPHAS